MAKLIERLRRTETTEARYSFDQWLSEMVASSFSYAGNSYTLPLNTSYGSSPVEPIGPSFQAHVSGAYRANGVVWACIMARLLVFSEARFQFQQRRNGRPGPLFGSPELGILENPWPNGTTGELLARMEQDASLAGNFFGVRETMAFLNRERITRLDPSRVQIALAGPEHNAPVIGIVYTDAMGADGEFYPIDEVAHWSPIPDPLAMYRGMSWLTPVLRNVEAHNAATIHKSKFFEHGATPNLLVTLPKEVRAEDAERFAERFRENNEGVRNAYKTLFLGGGADATVIGTNLQQIDFRSTAGSDETLIAAAAGVPATIVGISEGLAGSSLNAGNFAQAQRRFVDGTMRPLWRSASAALAAIVRVPAGAELTFDSRDIAFLRQDERDEAEIRVSEANAIRQLVDAGFNPDAVIDAVLTGDIDRLTGTHTGLFSVQLQAPGADTPTPDAPTPARRRIPVAEARGIDDGIYPPTPRQAAVYQALEDIVEVFGPFDQTTGPDGAHYVEASPFAAEGMVCSSCYFYDGPRACEIVGGDIAPEAVCKFWTIPAQLIQLPDPAA